MASNFFILINLTFVHTDFTKEITLKTNIEYELICKRYMQTHNLSFESGNYPRKNSVYSSVTNSHMSHHTPFTHGYLMNRGTRKI